jgi:hypothetical protein
VPPQKHAIPFARACAHVIAIPTTVRGVRTLLVPMLPLWWTSQLAFSAHTCAVSNCGKVYDLSMAMGMLVPTSLPADAFTPSGCDASFIPLERSGTFGLYVML